jgi:hypothetical protein
MQSLIIVLIVLTVFLFSYHGRKTILGFWGSFLFMSFSSLLFMPLIAFFAPLPGAAIIILLVGVKKLPQQPSK